MSMIRKYHKLQTTLWHRKEEPLNHHETPGRQIKQRNQLSGLAKKSEGSYLNPTGFGQCPFKCCGSVVINSCVVVVALIVYRGSVDGPCSAIQ